jgi:proteasome lid subunit RPN8/RPN11
LERLILSAEMRQCLFDHVRQSLPREAVGLLAGSARGVQRVLSLPNIAVSDRAFLADPFAQFCALRKIRAAGLELLAIYHSHPDGGPDPSPQDLKFAQAWPCAHVIVALSSDKNSAERLNAYRYLPSGLVENVMLII